MVRRVALFGSLLIVLAGCAPTVATTAAAEVQATAAPVAEAPVIANLKVPSTHLIGAETFDVKYDVARKGSGTFTSYGLKANGGEQLYPIKAKLGVIDNGHVDMGAIGPLPGPTVGGEQDVEFWVVDSAGMASNHLGFKMTVQ